MSASTIYVAIYVENGLTMLVNGRPLKAISHYWRMRIAKYESMLNGYGLKTSKRLRQMCMKWRRQVRHYINAKVRRALEWLYNVGVSMIKVGYPKYIAQENGDFDNVNVWTYGYLLRRISEVAEEYGINVVYVDEAYTSSRCPLHGDGCGARISRGLFRCTRMDKVFNADLAAAYNILMAPITPSPGRGRGNGPETRPRAKPSKKRGCSPNLPTLSREGGQSFRTGFLAPQTSHTRNLNLLSDVIFVSSPPQIGHFTNSLTYSSKSFLSSSSESLPWIISLSPSMELGLPDSFATNFARCDGSLLSLSARSLKFVTIVLLLS
jgi:IS605 OrfB family transposase